MIGPYYAALRKKIGRDLLVIPAIAAAIHDAEGRLLVIRRASGLLSLPAGAIEPGETPEESLAREVREETGLSVEPRALLGIFGGSQYRTRYPSGDEVEFVTAVFAARIISGSLEASGEGVPIFLAYEPGLPWETEFPAEIFAAPRS